MAPVSADCSTSTVNGHSFRFEIVTNVAGKIRHLLRGQGRGRVEPAPELIGPERWLVREIIPPVVRARSRYGTGPFFPFSRINRGLWPTADPRKCNRPTLARFMAEIHKGWSRGTIGYRDAQLDSSDFTAAMTLFVAGVPAMVIGSELALQGVGLGQMILAAPLGVLIGALVVGLLGRQAAASGVPSAYLGRCGVRVDRNDVFQPGSARR